MNLDFSKIERIREAKNITIAELSNKAGFAPVSYHKMKKDGAGNPKTSNLIGMAEALGVHPGELFTGNYKPTNQPHTVKEEKGAYTLPASDDYKGELVSMQKEMIAHLKSQLEYFKNKYETELALNMELKQAK